MTDKIDELAQFIRRVDGNNTMGAGALAEKICTEFSIASEDEVIVPRAVVKFLLGESELENASFGEIPLERAFVKFPPKFWWRKYLHEAMLSEASKGE